jgi:pimeloyl-ACP methyl ester carboxylesterase
MLDLFYRKYGDGNPELIILHGLYGSSDNWVSIAKKLAAKYTVYALDLRNHGNSPHTTTHTYEDLADDLYTFFNKQKINKAIVLGHSMGGKAAMSFAGKYPEKLSALFIVDIAPSEYTMQQIGSKKLEKHKNILQALADNDILNSETRQEAEKKILKHIQDKQTAMFILKNLKRTKEGFDWKFNAELIIKNIETILKAVEIPDGIKGFPCFFLKGAESDYINKNNINDIYKKFPAAGIVEIKNAGHWLHAEKPDELIKIIFEL